MRKISFFILLLFTGCQTEEFLSVDTEYKELLVVQSTLMPNTYFSGVRITKTLPLNTPFDTSLAYIKDAIVYLRINGIKSIPLHYFSNGIYKSIYDVKINSGEYYEIIGVRDKYSFYSKTKIPLLPSINSTTFNISDYYASAIINTYKDECYGSIWAVSDGEMKYSDDFFSIVIPDTLSGSNVVSTRTAAFPSKYRTTAFNGKKYIQIYSFDISYSDFFNTKQGLKSINNPYIQGTERTLWNVKGTDVIGMFIGMAKSNVIFVN